MGVRQPTDAEIENYKKALEKEERRNLEKSQKSQPAEVVAPVDVKEDPVSDVDTKPHVETEPEKVPMTFKPKKKMY